MDSIVSYKEANSFSLLVDNESIIVPVKDGSAAIHANLEALLKNSGIVVHDMGCTLTADITVQEICALTSGIVRLKAYTNKLYALVLGDIWNQIPPGYGNKTRLFKDAGIPAGSVKQMRTFGMITRIWWKEADRQKAGLSFLRETSRKCFSDKERRRFLEDYLAKRITVEEIIAEGKQRNEANKAAGFNDTGYEWDDADDEPKENEYNPPLLLAEENLVLLQAVRLLRGTPEYYDMQRVVAQRLCREQEIEFDLDDFDSALECCIPYPCYRPLEKAVAK